MSSRSPLAVRFGSRVRELREKRKQTLEDVITTGAGGSNGRLSRLERGQFSPTLRTVEELAGALEVEPLDLFVDSKAGLRHQAVAATLDANRAQLEQVLTVLRRVDPAVPAPTELRRRIATLERWMQGVLRDIVGELDQSHRAEGFGIGLSDLRPSELVLVGGVVAAFERFIDYRPGATIRARDNLGHAPKARSRRRRRAGAKSDE